MKALEEYAYYLASNVGTLKMSKAAFECLRIVRSLTVYCEKVKGADESV